MYTERNRVMGCLMGGAVGDAFGAPVEGIRELVILRQTYGKNGLQNFVHYKSPWDDAEQQGVGLITDDTTMGACTLAAIIEASKGKKFQETSLDFMYQNYLLWGVHQEYGEGLEKFVAKDYKAPGYLSPFLFRCGAGKNTMAALQQGYRGDIGKPVEYNVKFEGMKKAIVGPNKGCGGQMRIAPVAFLYGDVDLINYSSRAAAITHGHPDAIAATAATACLVANALRCDTLKEALHQTKKDIVTIPNNNGILNSWCLAQKAVTSQKPGIETMDNLGKSQGDNSFLALPVLTQTLYAVQVAAAIEKPTSEDFKNIMRLSVNHTGDSDSVAKMVGETLGANWGYDVLPKDWIDKVQQKDDVLILTSAYMKVARSLKHDA